MMNLLTKSLLTLLSVITMTVAATVAVKEGDACGINGASFLDEDFGGKNPVSGPGCTLSDGSSDCYCASLKDGDPFGEWFWQCNTADDTPVEFGPIEGKTCPEAIPVPKDYDGVIKTCETSVNPTGLAGDPSCPYFGGDMSAVCGCVDLDMYGIGEGQQWQCLHSTCSSDVGYCCTSADSAAHTVSFTAVSVSLILVAVFV